MDCKVKYDPNKHYAGIRQRLLIGITRGFDYRTWVENIYSDGSDIADAIDKLIGKTADSAKNAIAILRGQANEIEGAFGPRFRVGQTTVDPDTITIDSVPIGERRKDGLNIRSSFITESRSSNPTEKYVKTVNAFVKDIVESVIYNPKTKLLFDPNFERDGHTKLNQVLYDKRIQLMSVIWDKLHPDSKFSFEYTNEVEFTAAINRILNEYANKRSKLDPSDDVFAEYMTLKNFDAILESEFKNVIAVNKKFKNSQKVGYDMYDFIGGKVEHDTTWGDEFADASDYSGKLVKILLNYFKGKVDRGDGVYVDTDRAIGFSTFCNLTARVKEWAENGLNKGHLNIVYGDVNADWASLISDFIFHNKMSLTEDELAALNGIRISLMSNDNPELKEMFVNQAKKTVRYRYMTVKPAYNKDTGRMEMKTSLLEDNLIDRQNINCQKSVKTAVLKLRSSAVAKENLKKVFDYKVTDDTITINVNGKEILINYKKNDKTWDFTPTDSINYIDDNDAAQLIRMVIGQPIPGDIKSYLGKYAGKFPNLLSVFIEPIAFTLLAADDRTKEATEDAPITFTNGIVNTYRYYGIFSPAATLMNDIFGTQDTNVVRNEEGNALPSYQIISSVFNVKEWISRSKADSSLRSGIKYTSSKGAAVYEENILFRDHSAKHKVEHQPIGNICVRGDVTKDGITKSANQLTTKEVFHLELIENFYKRAQKNQSLILQPITFSDKKTHFLIEYMTKDIYIDDRDGNRGEALSDVVAGLISTNENDRILSESRMLSEIRYVRGQRTLQQLINVFKRFEKGLELNDLKPCNRDMTYADIVYNINKINDALKGYKDVQALRAKFGDKCDLEEALDIKKHDNFLEFNPILKLEAQLYISPDHTMWDTYIDRRIKASAKNLLKIGYEFDSMLDASCQSLIANWKGTLDAGWFDDKARTMKAVRVFDEFGNELILDTDAKIEAAFKNDGIRVELHPILTGYMLTDQLLSQSFVELLAGSTNSFTGKVELDPISDTMSIKDKLDAYERYIASNLSDEFKRTVLAGAIKTPYAQGKKYGVSSKWKIAVIDDKKETAYNYLGKNTRDKVQDGAGYASPYVSKQENESLREAAVGFGIKKTFLNYVDPETGVLREIKWAEFTITNRDRRASKHTERQFQLMHNLRIDPSDLSNIKLSEYYSIDTDTTSGDVFYDPDDDKRRISHNEELFYKDRTSDGIVYYRIDSVDSSFKDGKLIAIINRSIVSKDGKLIQKNVKPKIVEIKSIADLDSVFGGAYCMKRDEDQDTLVYSDANIDIVNNIICNCGLKDYMIAFTVNASAMKVGQINGNSSDVFSGNYNSLRYFEMESRYAGVQMNADHEIDEAQVSEMTQMMSALAQAGFGSKIVDRIYTLIGRIAKKNMQKYTDLFDKKDDKNTYLKIGKLFAESFLRNDRDFIGLAEAFVIAASKELAVGLDNIKIPFSSNQIKSIFQSTITSTFNKLGIRRKFPGIGAINSPGFNRHQVYKFGNDTMNLDDLQDRLVNDLRNKKLQGIASSYWNIDNVFDEQSSDGINIDNPYIERIKSDREMLDKISFEDTVVIRKIGTVGKGEAIHIKDIKQLDDLINFINLNEYEVYKWTIKPKELRQPIDTVEMVIDGTNESLRIRVTDLDSVRASFYLQYFEVPENITNLNDPETKLFNAKLEVINKVLAGCDVKISANSSEDDIKRALLWAQNQTQTILSALADGTWKGTIPETYKTLGSTVTLKNHKKERGQVVMGIANAKALGLYNSDKLHDILKHKSGFFQSRLMHKFKVPEQSEYNSKLYDAILYKPDGSPIFVVFGNVASSLDRLNGCIPSQNYIVNSDGNIEYNGEELFEAGGKAFFTTADGKYDVLVVDDPDAFTDVLNSKHHALLRYNYNKDNWRTLLRYQRPKNFKNGELKTSFNILGQEVNRKIWEDDSFYVNLNQAEYDDFTKNRIPDLAERQWLAFKSQLTYILARIPSQSMQSFMDVDVTLFTDSDLNEVYVPRALTYIQGSDYDIDKDYMMGFGLLPDGTLPTLSDLENEIDPNTITDEKYPNTGRVYDPYEILALRAPEGRHFEAKRILAGKTGGISVEDIKSIRENIKNLNIILTLPLDGENKSTVYFNRDVADSDIQYVMNLVKIHESSKRNGNRELLGLQNTVVRGILEVLGRPDVQNNMNNPITMHDLQEVAKNTTISADEQTMTLDDLLVKFKMQEQNMVGREVIGIGAVSLKHFFATATFLGHEINLAEQQLEEYERTGKINLDALAKHIIELCFDNKWNGSIATLANLNFKRLKQLLQRSPVKWFKVAKDYSQEYSEKGKRGLFELGFITINEDGSSTVNLLDLVNYLDKQSNGNWESPVDAAFALSQLISAATDNAKELILAKINATTKFADVWTYLLTTGMSIQQIGAIMTSPAFNVVAYYAQNNIFDKNSNSINLEDALKFVLDKQTLYRGYNKKFNSFLTYVGDGDFRDNQDLSFLIRLCIGKDASGKFNFNDLEKPNNILRRWYATYFLRPGEDIISIPFKESKFNDISILNKVRSVVKNKWDENLYKYTEDYENLMSFIYNEIATNPEAQQVLLDLLSENVDESVAYQPFDPDMIMFQDDAFIEDPDLISEFGDNIEDDGLDNFSGELDANSARTFYRYVKQILIPKNNKLAGISDEEKNKIKTLLDSVIPAMKEQQIHGQILGVNQGIKTKSYEEWNWIRKVENFINQRYLQSDQLENPIEFSLLLFLTDKEYQDKQIKQYEKVKSTVNILRSIKSSPNYNAMIDILRTNRNAIERAASIRIEHDIAERILRAEKTKAKVKNGKGGISTGCYYKFNPKEYKALQYAVSDALIFNFLKALNYSVPVPVGQKYYTSDGTEAISTRMSQAVIEFKNLHEIASFKKLMDEWVIPELIRTQGNSNAFLGNLTTGFKTDAQTGKPKTFYKLSFDISQIEKSPKLDALYSDVSRGFNALLYQEIDPDILPGHLKIGDLFYLYNLIVHKESLSGDSFTRIFDELAATGDKYSLLSAYRDFLGRIDNGDLRWDSPTEQGSNIIHYGDAISLDLRDMRYRTCLTEESQKKTRVKLTTDKKGYTTIVQMTDTKNKPTSGIDSEDLSKVNSDYTLGLPFLTHSYADVSHKSVSLNVDTGEQFEMNSMEVLSSIIRVLKTKSPNIPIHIISNEELEELPIEWDSRMESAVGFMVNGHIYINPDNFKGTNGDLSAPVHELMHIVCAAMKYGTDAERTLYYKMLDNIDKGDEDWKMFYDDMADSYSVTGSDLKEEVLVRAMTKAFLDGFEEQWNATTSVSLSNLDTVVRNILEDLLAVEFEGEVPLKQILAAPLDQIMAVFNSRFEGASQQRIIKTIIPINQKLARLKINLEKNLNLKIGDKC